MFVDIVNMSNVSAIRDSRLNTVRGLLRHKIFISLDIDVSILGHLP